MVSHEKLTTGVDSTAVSSKAEGSKPHPTKSHPTWKRGFWLSVLVVGALGGTIFWGAYTCGSLRNLLAFLSGQRVVVSAWPAREADSSIVRRAASRLPTRLHSIQKRKPYIICLKNLSPNPIRLLGCESTCTCVLPDVELPGSIKGFSEAKMVLWVHPDAGLTDVYKSITIYTSSPYAPIVQLSEDD